MMKNKKVIQFIKNAVSIVIVSFALVPTFLASSLGFKPIRLMATLRKIKSLMNAGKSLWTAVTAATGGGWLASLIVQFLLAWGIDAVLNNSWLAAF
ncbi:hypothetical protein [Streptococcus sp. DD13]|uniref:hypothetical protein n=1 Tax=Streptococcus sp. DD13 TaxID=1777881 RepID=UPI0007976037|nr:hypothetical protein [Streptococcus sp. DD13]KXT77832.1 hypothetical protein STRDD13_01246 [Streptococcus sp. DD13]